MAGDAGFEQATSVGLARQPIERHRYRETEDYGRSMPSPLPWRRSTHATTPRAATTRSTTPRPGPVRIELVFAAETPFFADWEEQWRRGERPTRWPYGLERLAHYADEVSFVAPRRARTWRRAIRPLTDVVADARARRGPGRDIGLAWEELVAARMVARRRHREMYCGAIWITDRVAAGDMTLRSITLDALRQMTGLFVLARPQTDGLVRILDGEGGRSGQLRASRVPHPDGRTAAERVSFVRFGIDTDFFTLRPLPDPAEAPLVLSVGTDPDRDWDTMFTAFARVREQVPQARFVVQARAGVEVPDWIESLPHLGFAQLRDVYAAASVVAVATRPNLHVSGMTVSMEARAMGRPVVLTHTAGMADYVADAGGAALVEPGDTEAMAAHLVRLVTDRAAAEAMGRAGRREVEAGMSIDHMIARLADVLGLERRRHPGRLVHLGVR